MLARAAVLGAALVCALLAVASAESSRPVATDARVLSLAVNDRGEALLVYRSGVVTRHVLAWGMSELRIDYSGGWRRYQRQYWRGFDGACGSYHGPRLAYAVAACTAPDGSYWAVQSVPGRAMEISHWRGPVAKIQAGTAWAYDGRFQVLFGRVTYANLPAGGRPIRLDTFRGSWGRESPFESHPQTGAFCYGFYPSSGGPGSRYRLAVSGTGGTPLVVANLGRGHAFDRSKSADIARQERAAHRLRSWGVSSLDSDCGPVLRMAAKLKGR